MPTRRQSFLIALGITLIVHAIVIGLLVVTKLKAATPKPNDLVEVLFIEIEPQTQKVPTGEMEEPTIGEVSKAPTNGETPTLPQAKPPRTNNPDPTKRPVNTSKNSNEPSISAGDEKIDADVDDAFSRGANRPTQAAAPEKGTQGNQGKATGASFSLAGRSVIGNGGRPERPTYTLALRGVIRISITVNPSGRVIAASIDPRGTDIADGNMRASAIEAAKKTQFNNTGSGTEQRGTITYHYEVR